MCERVRLHCQIPLKCTCVLPQDHEHYKVVPDSQFVISRTAHQSNASNYYIDDRKSNFTEVTDLLKGKGVDLDNNRFLILQVKPRRKISLATSAHVSFSSGKSCLVLLRTVNAGRGGADKHDEAKGADRA